LDELRQWAERAGLQLHPTKTRLVDMNQPGQGYDFLGYHFGRTKRGRLRRWPRQKSIKKFRDAVRMNTRRNNGHSMETIVKKLNLVVRGFFEYFKHSVPNSLRELDKWVRMRLRSIMRRRLHRRGRGRGSDHQRWPNAYFGKLGLFSMTEARALLCQSPQG
jgi:RNA-directed DNA polymerase